MISIDAQPSQFTTNVGSISDREFVNPLMQGVEHVYHTAALHKPHVGVQSAQDFIDTNITGTQVLLEAAVSCGVGSFVFTSSTSVFGAALKSTNGTVWIDSSVTPKPKNIYGVTKHAAENLCELAHKLNRLSCVVLRVSRFFLECDDDPTVANSIDNVNLKIVELLYRRVDISDVVQAHLLAAKQAQHLGIATLVVSATTPFNRDDTTDLFDHAPTVLSKYYPEYVEEFEKRGWKMLISLDRVYDNSSARLLLQWNPQHDFKSALDNLKSDEPWGSTLSSIIGVKGYGTKEY